MEYLEALVLNFLFPVTLNVTFQEIKSCLVGLDWVTEVIFEDWFGFSQERSNCFDAGRALEILRIDHLLEVLVHADTGRQLLELEVLKDPGEHRSESLEIPVLIDDLVDDARLEHLVRFVCKQIHEIVHLVDGLCVADVLAAPLRQQLLAECENEVPEVGIRGQLNAFSWRLHTEFDFVAHGSEQRLYQRLPLPI